MKIKRQVFKCSGCGSIRLLRTNDLSPRPCSSCKSKFYFVRPYWRKNIRGAKPDIITKEELERNIQARFLGQPFSTPISKQIEHPDYWETINKIYWLLFKTPHQRAMHKYYLKNKDKFVEANHRWILKQKLDK